MMLSAIRRRVTYANIAVTVAVVFAMSGGAYAASRYVITSTKQISPKVLRALRGSNGSNGAAGATGPGGAAGAVGSQGPAGPAGAKGETGAAGVPGAPGTPGTPGKKGEPGSPWTAGGTLPKGASETGVWGLSGTGKENTAVFIPISFPIPLAASLDAAHVHLIGFGEPAPKGCLGSSEKPEAEPGNLCIWGALQGGEFLSLATGNVENGNTGAGRDGEVLEGNVPTEGGTGRGDWVVSGP